MRSNGAGLTKCNTPTAIIERPVATMENCNAREGRSRVDMAVGSTREGRAWLRAFVGRRTIVDRARGALESCRTIISKGSL
jgi:hypothetical protein